MGISVAILLLVILEFGLGFFDLPEYESNITHFFLDHRGNTSLYVPDSDLFWMPKVNELTGFNKFHTRGNPPEKEKKRIRILCLGDSVTYGYKLKTRQSYPYKLGRILGDKAEVLNSGVCGYTIVQGARFFNRDLATLKPDIVLAAFGHNDPQIAYVEDINITQVPNIIWYAHKGLSRLRVFGLIASRMFKAENEGELIARVSQETYALLSRRLDKAVTASGGKLVFLTFPTYKRDSKTMENPFYMPPQDLTSVDIRQAFEELPQEQINAGFYDEIHHTEVGTTKIAEFLAMWLINNGYINNGENFHE